MKAPLSEPFFTRKMKMLAVPDGCMLYGKLCVNFFSTSELLYPNMKIRLRLIRVRPSFYMNTDNPNVSPGSVDCSIYTRRIALKDDYHKTRMDMLAYTPVEFNYLETLANIFVSPARQNQFIQGNIFNNALQFVGLLLHLIETLHSLDRTLKLQSGFNILISDKLEYSEVVREM